MKPDRTASVAEGPPQRRSPVAELEARVAGGDDRVELIGGELVPMSPKGYRHKLVKRALVDRWIRLRPEDSRLFQETTLRFAEGAFLEPDIVIDPLAGAARERR